MPSRWLYVIVSFAATMLISDVQGAREYLRAVMIDTSKGPINASLERWNNDMGGNMAKILVALKIPYAAAPTGELRFRKPQMHDKWTVPLNTNRWSGSLQLHSCPQPSMESKRRRKRATQEDIFAFWNERMWIQPVVGGITAANSSEDCLHLNVWAPVHDDGTIFADREKKPVMVFIHGGAYTMGSAYSNLHEGTALSLKTDTVIVTINYRLGPFGFLKSEVESSAGGNMGLMDQQMALEWVKDNVEHFGGDPDRVTIFGESAGSESVHYHLMNADSSELFHRAIMESGVAVAGGWAYEDPKKARERGLKEAVKVGCANAESKVDHEVLACMRTKDVKAFLAAWDEEYKPTTDDTFFPYSMEESLKKLDAAGANVKSRKPILVGFNRDEGSFIPFYSGMFFEAYGVAQDSFLDRHLFDHFIQGRTALAKDPFVADKIAGKYYDARMSGLIEFVSERSFVCDTSKTADRLKKAGYDVRTYLYDSPWEFAQKVFPYLRSSHEFELIAVWLRPWVNAAPYTDEERAFSNYVATMWGHFAHGKEGTTIPETGLGEAFVLTKKDPYEIKKETINVDRCKFLRCIPSLAEYSEAGTVKDSECLEFVASGADEKETSILNMFTLFKRVVQTLYERCLDAIAS